MKLLLILMTCLAFSVYGQTTLQPVNIRGTHLYVVPPPGFVQATAFLGLQREDGAAFQIYDLVGDNYYKIPTTFSKEGFERKGVKVIEYKELSIDSFPAKYVSMESTGLSKAVGINFGDSTFSVMVVITYPTTDEQTEAELQETIKTLHYDKKLWIDPFATAVFTLDESKSGFKFAQSTAGLFAYSIGGKVENSDQDEAFVLVSTLPKDASMNTKSVLTMWIAKLEQHGLSNKNLKNGSEADINDQPAYEVEVYGDMQGKASLIYLLIVTGEDKAIVIQGIIKSGFEENLVEVKKLARTIKLK